MGFTAHVETDIGDYLKVLHDDEENFDIFGGKAILSFLTALDVYCSSEEENELAEIRYWFSKLEANVKKPICRLMQPLIQSYYSGNWAYAEDEYELFLHRSPQGQLTEDEFRKTIQDVEQKWVEINPLLVSVNELIKLLTETDLETTWWYEPEVTESDFQALVRTLSLAAKRKAEQVRIQFV